MGNDKRSISDIIEEDNNVTLKQDSMITLILVVFMFKLLAIFWLHTDWIDKDDIASANDNVGVIIDISLIPSNPSILVVIILYNRPKTFMAIITSMMFFIFFTVLIIIPPYFSLFIIKNML